MISQHKDVIVSIIALLFGVVSTFSGLACETLDIEGTSLLCNGVYLGLWCFLARRQRHSPNVTVMSTGLFSLLGTAAIHGAYLLSCFFTALSMKNLIIFSPMLPLMITLQRHTIIGKYDLKILVLLTSIIPFGIGISMTHYYREGVEKH